MIHRIINKDIMIDDLDGLMQEMKADIMYVDPPWGLANLKYWRTLNNQKGTEVCWKLFLERLKHLKEKHVIGESYIETGLRFIADVESIIGKPDKIYTVKYKAGLKYFNNAILIYDKNFDEDLIDEGGFSLVWSCLKKHHGKSVFDPCIGLGMTAKVAKKLDMTVYGNDLNKKRAKRTCKILGVDLCQ